MSLTTEFLAIARQRLGTAMERLRNLPRTPGGWRSKRLGHDAARRGDWRAAATHYAAALAGNRHMAPIWSCLGSAQLELGDPEAAGGSFERAAALAPTDPMPRRSLARVAQASGRRAEAASHLLAAYEQSREFNDLCSFAGALPHDGQRAALIGQAAQLAPRFPPDSVGAARPPGRLVLDISELLLWYRSFRLPSGVQRVQIGLIGALLSSDDAGAVACRFDGGSWQAIGTDALLHLLALSEISDRLDEPAWQDALLATYLSISSGGRIDFVADSVLVSLGSWVTTEFMDAVDAAKRHVNLRYVPLIYDLIPIFRPEWFPPGVAANFPQWLDRLALTADAYMTISESTKRDLCRIADQRGHRLDPARVTVMALDADCRSGAPAGDASATLDRHGLTDRGYVLMVGTIEPRKNHAGALRAWRRLLDGQSPGKVPRLVFVGHGGWNNAEVHRLLRNDRELAARTMILSGVPDGELTVLYRHARFVLYPSLYEGWGLPVTEALCYGKAVAAANNSSLPEAGGRFADYFDGGRVDEIAAAAGRLIDDDGYLAGRERAIAEAFSPRGWRDLAADLEGAAAGARAM